GPVVLDAQVFDERRVRAPGAHRRELCADVLDGLGHLVLRLFKQQRREGVVHQRTSVPTRSPARARLMLPRPIRSNTWIGSLLSMQNVIAVRSITRSSLLSTSMKEISS